MQHDAERIFPDSPKMQKAYRIIHTNSFNLASTGNISGRVFSVTPSRINHACSGYENSVYFTSAFSITIFSQCDIRKGEEITIFYGEKGDPKSVVYFDCQCIKCTNNTIQPRMPEVFDKYQMEIFKWITIWIIGGTLPRDKTQLLIWWFGCNPPPDTHSINWIFIQGVMDGFIEWIIQHVLIMNRNTGVDFPFMDNLISWMITFCALTHDESIANVKKYYPILQKQ